MTDTFTQPDPLLIDPDIAAVVGVVLGHDRHDLTGENLRMALQAMTALGYSTTYMAEALGRERRKISSLASKMRVKLGTNREFVDWRAVAFVVDDGTPMHLAGNDRDAALAQLAARGTTAKECARLLHTTTAAILSRVSSLGLELEPTPTRTCWWSHYFEDLRSKPAATAADETPKEHA